MKSCLPKFQNLTLCDDISRGKIGIKDSYYEI